MPGSEPDSKIRMLQQLQDDVERSSLPSTPQTSRKNEPGTGINGDLFDVLYRLIDIFFRGILMWAVVMSRYSGWWAADAF